MIRDEELERVHSYIGQLVNRTGSRVIRVGGTCDHVHILFLLSRNGCISNVVEETKRNSSRWIKSIDPHYGMFAWQGGYGVFSVSQSMVDKTLKYIERQREHHQKLTFEDEYIEFLKLYDIEYDEKYVFSD